jgi:hypothetical protein
MNHNTFDAFARRSADLLDRRSFLGGVGSALLITGGTPLESEAKNNEKKGKACKKRMKLCRTDLRYDVCEGVSECINDLNKCCKKACKSTQKAIDCCENAGWCL